MEEVFWKKGEWGESSYLECQYLIRQENLKLGKEETPEGSLVWNGRKYMSFWEGDRIELNIQNNYGFYTLQWIVVICLTWVVYVVESCFVPELFYKDLLFWLVLQIFYKNLPSDFKPVVMVRLIKKFIFGCKIVIKYVMSFFVY